MLKLIYDSQEEIPEGFASLYTEKDGKWVLTGVEGIKSQEDIDRVTEALRKESEDHKETKEKLKAFDGIDPEQVGKDKEELETLRAKIEAGEGTEIDQEKFDAAVEKVSDAKVKAATAPLEHQIKTITEDRDRLKVANDRHEERERSRTISDAVRTVAVESKVVPSAMEDVLLLAERMFEVTDNGGVVTRDQVGVIPGIDPKLWLSEMKEKRPHWWPLTDGGGADGGSGQQIANNPFSRKHWNRTEQGRLVREDRDKAERYAKAAGTSIGGDMPAEAAA